MAISKQASRARIKMRIKKKVSGSAETPRLSVYRSNKEIYAQIIDDVKGVTLAAASSLGNKEAHNVAKVEQAAIVGKALASAALEKGISKVVFDRNGCLYHGRVKSLADAAREGGLNF